MCWVWLMVGFYKGVAVRVCALGEDIHRRGAGGAEGKLFYGKGLWWLENFLGLCIRVVGLAVGVRARWL